MEIITILSMSYFFMYFSINIFRNNKKDFRNNIRNKNNIKKNIRNKK